MLVDNIGAYKENGILDNKVTGVANKSTEMDKQVTKNDIKFTKGQAVKVCLGCKERIGEVWRLQSNGCISVLFKDTNSIGAYPKKFIKAAEENNKPKIKLLRDLKDLREDFLKGNIYEVWQEKSRNYVIYLDGTFYEPLKENCEIV